MHMIGIGGSGLSAIARVLVESGYKVTGSDQLVTLTTRSLEESGIQVFIGHQPENVAGADLVIRSSAIPDNNVEVQAARSADIPVVKRADFLSQWMVDRYGIAVAGTHGKTTTTAMISWMLSESGQDPTYIIGGVSKNLGTNARSGKSPLFVIEADEYDGMFLGLQPRIAVVTNIDYDHIDCYPTREDYYLAFREFTRHLGTSGILLACLDDPGAERLLVDAIELGLKAFAYGIHTETVAEHQKRDYRAGNLTLNNYGGITFDAFVPKSKSESRTSWKIALQVPGVHNIRNALAAFAVADLLGLPLTQAANALAEYQGTARRFEVRGEAEGVTVIDDYAHHPAEIQATLAAAKARYPKSSLWAVWQPHTYSRTQAFFNEFTNSFKDADHVVVTEVYAAREPVLAGFSARQIVSAMDHPDAHFLPDFAQATDFLLEQMAPGDVLIVLSAGDATQISDQIIASNTGFKISKQIPGDR